MNSEELITVVIPVFQVELYLRECLDSVINQSYKKIEIILIDDGSPDSCPQICEEYAEKDSRIKVIHKENEGVSVARNIGIELAKGKYITFIDGDDYVDRNYIKLLYDNMNGCRISECGVTYFNKDYSRKSKKGVPKTLGWKEYLTETNLGGFLSYAIVWGKLYDKTLFENIRFPVGRINGEDEATVFKLVYEADKVSRIYDPNYFYRQRDDGASRNLISKKRIDDAELLFRDKIEFFYEKHEKDMVFFYEAKETICFLGMWRKTNDIADKKYCMEFVLKLLPHFIKEKIVPIKYKVYILLMIIYGKIL